MHCCSADQHMISAQGNWSNSAISAIVCPGAGVGGRSCVPNTKRCHDPGGNTAQTCDATGNWGGDQACMFLCATGNCTGTCTPNATQCSGTTLQTCDVSGSWQDTMTCPYACTGAACSGLCVPTSKRCSGL